MNAARITTGLAIVATAASLFTTAGYAHHAPDDAHEVDITIPAGCTFIGVTHDEDERFPMARCADGSYLYADLDSDGTWRDGSVYAIERGYGQGLQ